MRGNILILTGVYNVTYILSESASGNDLCSRFFHAGLGFSTFLKYKEGKNITSPFALFVF